MRSLPLGCLLALSFLPFFLVQSAPTEPSKSSNSLSKAPENEAQVAGDGLNHFKQMDQPIEQLEMVADKENKLHSRHKRYGYGYGGYGYGGGWNRGYGGYRNYGYGGYRNYGYGGYGGYPSYGGYGNYGGYGGYPYYGGYYG